MSCILLNVSCLQLRLMHTGGGGGGGRNPASPAPPASAILIRAGGNQETLSGSLVPEIKQQVLPHCLYSVYFINTGDTRSNSNQNASFVQKKRLKHSSAATLQEKTRTVHTCERPPGAHHQNNTTSVLYSASRTYDSVC